MGRSVFAQSRFAGLRIRQTATENHAQTHASLAGFARERTTTVLLGGCKELLSVFYVVFFACGGHCFVQRAVRAGFQSNR